ncbi:MAG: hypothetical protein IJD22_02590 [Clostridia bacterium]|nr:hypothetical protein [Clostridia bacterium]
MKKILSAILCFVLLFGMLSVFVAADDNETDIEFSMTDASGKPGEIITVEVYLDKNVGTWATCFEIVFNERYFTLLSVENGDVYTDGEYVKSKLTNRGRYRYYAEGTDYNVNVTNTGLIATFNFEISESAPAGDYAMRLFFPDDGKGWFFDATEFPDYLTVFTVAATNDSKITVINDSETAAPDTDAPVDGSNSTDSTDAPADDTTVENDLPGIPVYDNVTDADGNLATDTNGDYIKTPARDDKGNLLYYETDKYNEVVTDEKGDNVTFADTTATPESTGDKVSDSQTAANNSGTEGEKNSSAYKIILIAAVAAVVVGAIIVVIVLTRPKKNEKE